MLGTVLTLLQWTMEGAPDGREEEAEDGHEGVDVDQAAEDDVSEIFSWWHKPVTPGLTECIVRLSVGVCTMYHNEADILQKQGCGPSYRSGH